MNEEWRAILYPFGFIAQGLFGLRFLVQWIASERKKRSVTPFLFWQLSLVGNLVLLFHSLIQLYFPMSLVQAINSIMSWRNMNLLGPKSRQVRFSTVLTTLFFGASLIVGFFLLQSDAISWLASPHSAHISWGIHLLGIIGILSFAVRFWVQWWQAESNKEGHLTESFWWISLFGAYVSGIYFFVVNDWVNFIGPLFGLVPYTRNLYFIRKRAKVTR